MNKNPEPDEPEDYELAYMHPDQREAFEEWLKRAVPAQPQEAF